MDSRIDPLGLRRPPAGRRQDLPQPRRPRRQPRPRGARARHAPAQRRPHPRRAAHALRRGLQQRGRAARAGRRQRRQGRVVDELPRHRGPGARPARGPRQGAQHPLIAEGTVSAASSTTSTPACSSRSTEGSARHRGRRTVPPPSPYGCRMAFDHLVLTRFSAVRRGQVEPMPPEWLTYRLGFFYDACHPSLTRQVGRAPFRWLVFLDDRCPDAFREQVEELAHGAFEPVWGHEDFHGVALPQAIERYAAASGPSHLITSRVDSDDAVARDFVAAVQAQFERLPRDGLGPRRGRPPLRQLHAGAAGRPVRSGLPSRPAARTVPLPDRAPRAPATHPARCTRRSTTSPAARRRCSRCGPSRCGCRCCTTPTCATSSPGRRCPHAC